MKYITVFCSACDLDEKYTESAKEFATLLVKNKYGLVWGGSNVGLMKVIASTVQENHGRLVGISVEHLQHKARQNVDEMIIAKTLGERKATMLERGDAIVLLVGGIGSLDEITEIVEFKKHGFHNKPIVILNTEHFYDGLKTQLEKMQDEGFLTSSVEHLIHFADTPQKAIEYLNTQLQ